MKKILVLAFEFPPIRASNDRTYHLCRFLPRHGWKPIVVSPRKATRWLPSDDTIIVPPEIERHDAPALDNFLVYFGRKYLGIFPDRNLYFFACLRSGLRVLKDQSTNIDIIYSSTPPVSSLFAAYLLARKFRKPLILDFRDPYFPLGIFRKHYKKVLGQAHYIITTTEVYRNNLIKQGANPKRTIVIPNGTDLSLIESVKAEGIQRNPRLTVIYAGAYFKTYRIRQLIEIALKVRSLNIKFVIVGTPDEGEENLVNFVQEHQLTNVEFKGRLTQNETIRELLRATIAYNGSSHPGGVGGKVYDYLACGLPILGFNEPNSASDHFIRNYQIGLTSNNINKVQESLIQLYNTPTLLEAFQKKAIATASLFNREKITEQFVKILNKTILE